MKARSDADVGQVPGEVEEELLCAEVVIIVFDPPRPVAGESEFHTAARGPAAAVIGCDGRGGGCGASGENLSGVAGIRPGYATFPIKEHGVPGVAQPPGQGREKIRVDGGVERRARDQRGDGGGTVGVGPRQVAFDTDDPGAGLVVDADLAAGLSRTLVTVWSPQTPPTCPPR